jgi:hypothetical protein
LVQFRVEPEDSIASGDLKLKTASGDLLPQVRGLASELKLGQPSGDLLVQFRVEPEDSIASGDLKLKTEVRGLLQGT